MPSTRFLIAALAAGLAGAALTAPLTLNVKPGLWEVTTQGEVTGAPPVPPEMLAAMPPERRAKFEAAIAASMARAAKPRVAQHCMTEEKLQHGFDTEEKTEHRCTQNVISSTGTVMDVSQQCDMGRGKMSGRMHFEARDGETVDGTIDFTVSNGANTMTSKHVFHAKWLGADCGSVQD